MDYIDHANIDRTSYIDSVSANFLEDIESIIGVQTDGKVSAKLEAIIKQYTKVIIRESIHDINIQKEAFNK